MVSFSFTQYQMVKITEWDPWTGTWEGSPSQTHRWSGQHQQSLTGCLRGRQNGHVMIKEEGNSTRTSKTLPCKNFKKFCTRKMHVSCLETNENEWCTTYMESMQWIDLKAQFFWSEKGGKKTTFLHKWKSASTKVREWVELWTGWIKWLQNMQWKNIDYEYGEQKPHQTTKVNLWEKHNSQTNRHVQGHRWI